MLRTIVLTCLCVACLYACAGAAPGWETGALLIGALLFLVSDGVILYQVITEARGAWYRDLCEVAQALAVLAPEDKAALNFKFPSLRYRMNETELTAFFEDTHVLRSQFETFLKDSNARETSARRDWNTIEKPRAVHIEIIQELTRLGYVYEESAGGSRSWLWLDGAYNFLCAAWLARSVPNLNRFSSGVGVGVGLIGGEAEDEE